MSKREFVQLANVFDPKKHNPVGLLASEKYDGMRAFWDGGVSKGVLSTNVPYANTAKDKKLVLSTGLWSRKGKVIWAPEWWLAKLPALPLDGELWSPDLNFQEITSIVRSQAGDDRWKSINYMVFDSPNYMFAPGEIYMGVGEPKLEITNSAREWWLSKGGSEFQLGTSFGLRMHILSEHANSTLKIVQHTRVDGLSHLNHMLDDVLHRGGEGLILREPNGVWFPQRNNTLLKVKDFKDSEATVTGYIWGRGKLEGMIGAVVVNWNGKRLELSGFTDAEREISTITTPCPGEPILGGNSEHFPIGSEITFRYRELTMDGIPKEARFLRKV